MSRLRRERGFSLLELAIATLIVGVFILVLSQRLLTMQRLAEKAAVDGMVQNLESGLLMQASVYIIEGRERQIEGLLHADPFLWLERPPGNYLGGWRDGATAVPGNWYYDSGGSAVVYQPRAEINGGKPLRFGLVKKPGRQHVVALVPQSAYDWRI